MPHLFINHHFFFTDDKNRKSFRGPKPEQVLLQLQALMEVARPAKSIRENLNSGGLVFSMTVDDGVRSFLNVVEIFQDLKIHVCLCVCGKSTEHQEVLLIHKINLLRSELSDTELYSRLLLYFQDFEAESHPLRGNVTTKDLYRYDQPVTRRLKIALNYQIDYTQTKEFVDNLFLRIFGNEKTYSKSLYLSGKELANLQTLDGIELVYHGTEHRLWAELTDPKALIHEITPTPKLEHLFRTPFYLSIPYGMNGSFDEGSLVRFSGKAVGAFTMGRNFNHKKQKSPDDFCWLHRFDQADLFDPSGRLKNNVIASIASGCETMKYNDE